MSLEVELWAWEGLVRTATVNTASIASQAETATEFPTPVIEALIRASYGAGYAHALREPELSYAEAMSRRDKLKLMLPVA